MVRCSDLLSAMLAPFARMRGPLAGVLRRGVTAAARPMGTVRRLHATPRPTVEATKAVASATDIPDPMDVFDNIDANGDGVLSREEFLTALDQLSLDELVAISRGLSRNELSRTHGDEEAEGEGGSLIMARLTSMVDVTVSKIFPAGFGWQMFSGFAEDAGFKADELPFFLMTGAGDFAGVFVGHTGFSMIKKAAGAEINITNEAQTGLLLATAAFCSGTAWQPAVNAFTNLGLSFNQAVTGTVVICGSAFFGGLRLGRMMYSNIMPGVEGATYGNLKADAWLSLSIGGATGCFVGTDIGFADNWLRPVVGIEDNFSVLLGEAKAGTSTALGFMAFQTVQTFAMPAGKCWVD